MDTIVAAVTPLSSTRLIKKGTTILYQGEIPRSAFVIKKGLVRAYTITSNGDERTVTLHSHRDIFPLSWVFSETPSSLFYYEALTDCELLCIPKEDLLNTITSNPAHLQTMLSFAINGYTSLQMRVTALSQATAAEKIAVTLYYLLIRHGIEKKPQEFTINLKMTQSTIASLVGITRESTAVNLKILQKRGVISYRNFIYVVNKQKLEQFIGEDYFKDLVLS